MRYIYLSVLITGVLLGGGMTDTNPIQTATAGAYLIRTLGNDASGLNPANLGYYGKPINWVTAPNEKYNFIELMEKDTLFASVDSTQKYYSIQLIASQDKKHMKETKKTFHNQFGKNIPSAIIKMNSLYKLQVGDFIDRYNAVILQVSVIAKGYKDAWIVSHNYPLEKPEQILAEKSFYFEFLNMGRTSSLPLIIPTLYVSAS